MKQYLVHTSGEVIDRQAKAYVVKAESEEQAQEIAKINFAEEFYVMDECIYAKPYKRSWKAILSIVFMLIPIGLSLIGWRVGHEAIYIRPNYLSCLYAIFIYAAFVVRFKGIPRAFETKLDIVLCVSVILLLSSFIQTLLVTKNINILGLKEIPIDTKIVILFAIVLSWFGLKLVSAICMMGVGILAIFNIATLSNAMGNLFGPLYIISAFIGIVLYLSIEPAVIEALPYLRKSVNNGIDYLKRDFIEAGRTANNIRGSASNSKDKIMHRTKEIFKEDK